jgi:hypothetical protein
MVDSRLAASFWSAVKDCLVTFHQFAPGDAAEKVSQFWLSLSSAPPPARETGFEDMVYHSEPWYIACNLAESDLPLLPNLQAYHEILSRNGLVSELPYASNSAYSCQQNRLVTG